MEFSCIGKEIKYLRKIQGLSQKELSQGICTQAQISKIEKGEVHPLSSTLYLIAMRLGVDINYFFDIATAPRIDYVNEVMLQIRESVYNINYEEVRAIIKAEENNPVFNRVKKFKQFLIWHQGMCEYFINRNHNKSLDLLYNAFEMTYNRKNMLSEREIEILNSIGVIYLEINENQKAIEKFEEALTQLKNIVFLKNTKIIVRICYNLAKVLTRNKEYERSINVCNEGIVWCKKHHILYLFGELHFQLGYNHNLLNNKDCETFFKKAINIFELNDKQSYIEHIRKKFF
jgi:transcriptional regulator with XRE-family HTH domain